MKEKWESNGKTAPPKALFLFLFYSKIQSPDLQLCSLFSPYSPFFIFAFSLPDVHADREIRFQILSCLGCFSIYYCLPSSLLLSVLPRKAMYGFLFDSARQSDSFQLGTETHKRKKEDGEQQTCQELKCSLPPVSVQNS